MSVCVFFFLAVSAVLLTDVFFFSFFSSFLFFCFVTKQERIYRCGGTVECMEGGVPRVNGDLAVSRCFGDADYKKTGVLSTLLF